MRVYVVTVLSSVFVCLPCNAIDDVAEVVIASGHLISDITFLVLLYYSSSLVFLYDDTLTHALFAVTL